MTKYLITYLTKLINKYIEKIGEVDSENYNEELDCICSELLDLRYRIQNIECKINTELRSDKK